MQSRYLLTVSLCLSLFFAACSKKHTPQKETTSTATTEKKKEIKVVKRVPTPKVITVDDRAARKTADGRLYYDLEGHRYWRNYDDGKYYLYNKSMYNNPAFKPH